MTRLARIGVCLAVALTAASPALARGGGGHGGGGFGGGGFGGGHMGGGGGFHGGGGFGGGAHFAAVDSAAAVRNSRVADFAVVARSLRASAAVARNS